MQKEHKEPISNLDSLKKIKEAEEHAEETLKTAEKRKNDILESAKRQAIEILGKSHSDSIKDREIKIEKIESEISKEKQKIAADTEKEVESILVKSNEFVANNSKKISSDFLRKIREL